MANRSGQSRNKTPAVRDLAKLAQPYDWLSWLYCRLGALLARPLVARGVHPNLVTALGPVSALLGALALVVLDWKAVFIVMAMLAYLADELDGIVARGSGKTSAFGGWFDAKCGEAKDWILSLALITAWLLAILQGWKTNAPGVDWFSAWFILVPLCYLVLKGMYYSIRWFPPREARPHAHAAYRVPPVCIVGDAFKVTIVYPLAACVFEVFAVYLAVYTVLYGGGILVHLRTQYRVQQQPVPTRKGL